MLRILLTFALILLFGCSEKQQPTEAAQPQKKPAFVSATVDKDRAATQRKAEIDETAQKSTPVQVNATAIKGRKLGGLYAEITGISGEVTKDSYQINYGEILAGLWKRKVDRQAATEATIDNAHKPLKVYLEDQRRMSLGDFVGEAGKHVEQVKKNLDWSGVCKKYNLNKAECDMFQKLGKKVTGGHLVAYGMTEIMPSAEGELNLNILEMLLKHAGSNYMFTIPALYDGMLSLGFYQFTSYALRHDSGGVIGASTVNMFLSKADQIPGSVIRLENGQHHRAAYLFALHNFAQLAKRTSVKEFRVLEKAFTRKPSELVTFMATSHHAPTLALRHTRAWLKSGAKDELNRYLRGRLIPYGKKSDNNFAALKKRKLVQ